MHRRGQKQCIGTAKNIFTIFLDLLVVKVPRTYYYRSAIIIRKGYLNKQQIFSEVELSTAVWNIKLHHNCLSATSLYVLSGNMHYLKFSTQLLLEGSFTW